MERKIYIMIVIRKKTILNCLMLFCIVYMSYALIKSSSKEEQVVALPVSEKVIVIDAGHRSVKMEVQYLKMEHLKLI